MKGNELQLLVCTANLGNAAPDKGSLAAWIPDDGRCHSVLRYPAKYPIRNQFSTFDEFRPNDRFDIIVLGMQEATFDRPSTDDAGGGDSSGLSKTIATLTSLVASRDYTKKNRNGSLLNGGTASVGAAATAGEAGDAAWDDGTAYIHQLLEARLPSYSRQVSFQRGQMRLEVFVLQEQTTGGPNTITVQVLHTKAQNTGRAGLANKGGIVTELLINGKTRLAFLTAHLEAHEGIQKYQQRCSSLADILAGTRSNLHDISLTAHYCFVMGDLNFRSDFDNPNLSEEEHKERVKQIVIAQNWQELNKIDELQKALRCKDCLVGFNTPLCNFPPTFKMERLPGYTYVEKRRPSYTDRVLYKTSPGLESRLRLYVYEPIDEFASSDHKPVRAAFGLQLNNPVVVRAKMQRRRSAMQVAGDWLTHSVKSELVVSHKERLHIFLSNISCQLGSAALSSSATTPPNPYMCIVSDPEEAVKKKLSRWERWMKFFFQKSRDKAVTGNQPHITSLGWPQSSIQKLTFEPNWGEEELHTEIRTYTPDGAPLDLSGAMLRFTVMDYRGSSGEDQVLGTICYNLGQLLRTFCPPSEAKQSEPPLESPPRRKRSGAGQRRGSILNMFVRTSGSESSQGGRGVTDAAAAAEAADLSEGNDAEPVISIPIDAPLIRNGIETGRIRMSIDAWWMTESTARALMGNKSPNKRKKKKKKGKENASTIVDPIEEAANSTHVFSQRHQSSRQLKRGSQNG